ncbi:helix-turn-helix transcriptional regulator [Marivita sp. S2033]|uniref:helix-turn-helix transcriptional regulator n=1 Tax=Marivita sp. S2033 TaxID=3373187 RepID=UPI0039820E36
MNATADNLYLSVDQVAKRFDVSKDSIWRWKRNGDFPKPVRLGGSTTRWRLSDIEDWEVQRPCCLATELTFAPDKLFAG